jgi:hypothetical protein
MPRESRVMGTSSRPAKHTPHQPARAHGEDWLDRLETLTIRLENGDEATFHIRAEVEIAHDAGVVALRRLEERSPGRLAFWSYQVARQRRAVHTAHRRLGEVEAEFDLVARKYVAEHTDLQSTERAVRSHADLQPEVKRARLAFDEASYVLEVLEAVREAVRTRSFVLGRLLTTQANASEGS